MVDIQTSTTQEPANENVDFSRKLLDHVPLDLIKSPETIKRLSLASNKLDKLSNEILAFRNLTYLNIRQNNFKQFPLVLCQLRLNILDISKNKITKLPNDFGELLHLKALNVAKNKIIFLPNYIGKMEELEVLQLEGNNFRFPPQEIIEVNKENAEGWLVRLKEYLNYAGKIISGFVTIAAGKVGEMIEAAELAKSEDILKEFESKLNKILHSSSKGDFSVELLINVSFASLTLLKTQYRSRAIERLKHRLNLKSLELLNSFMYKNDIAFSVLLEVTLLMKHVFEAMQNEIMSMLKLDRRIAKRLILDLYDCTLCVKEAYELVLSCRPGITPYITSESETKLGQVPHAAETVCRSALLVCDFTKDAGITISSLNIAEMLSLANEDFKKALTLSENYFEMFNKDCTLLVMYITKLIKEIKQYSETTTFNNEFIGSIQVLGKSTKNLAIILRHYNQ